MPRADFVAARRCRRVPIAAISPMSWLLSGQLSPPDTAGAPNAGRRSIIWLQRRLVNLRGASRWAGWSKSAYPRRTRPLKLGLVLDCWPGRRLFSITFIQARNNLSVRCCRARSRAPPSWRPSVQRRETPIYHIGLRGVASSHLACRPLGSPSTRLGIARKTVGQGQWASSNKGKTAGRASK